MTVTDFHQRLHFQTNTISSRDRSGFARYFFLFVVAIYDHSGGQEPGQLGIAMTEILTDRWTDAKTTEREENDRVVTKVLLACAND